MRRIISLVMTLALLVAMAAPAAAADTAAATTLRLEKTEGTVTVKKASGKDVKLKDSMRLYSGYTLKTDKNSYAYISLDSGKAVKLGGSSEAEVRKSGKKLELKLLSGELFFDVSIPLKSDESLNIRTSTMVTGVRGTVGFVKVYDRFHSEIALLEGKLEVQGTRETGATISKPVTLTGGNKLIAASELPAPGQITQEIRLTVEPLVEKEVPGFVAVEVAEDLGIQKRIEENTTLSVPEIIGEARERLEREEQEAEKAAEEILRQVEEQEAEIGEEPVTQVFEPAPTPTPVPTREPVYIPPAQVSVSGNVTSSDLEEAFRTATSSVTVEPDAVVTISDKMSIPADKTLTVSGGGTLTVSDGGTLTVSGRGALTVAAGGTLTVENQATLTVEKDGALTVTGEVKLADGGTLVVGPGAVLNASGENARVTVSGGSELTVGEGSSMTLDKGATLYVGGEDDVNNILTVSTDATLTAKEGSQIRVESGSTLTVDGTVNVDNNGGMINNGVIDIKSVKSVHVAGSLTNSGWINVGGFVEEEKETPIPTETPAPEETPAPTESPAPDELPGLLEIAEGGTLEMTGGSIVLTASSRLENNSGKILLGDGSISSTSGTAIVNGGTVEIDGDGTISSASGTAIVNRDTVKITGGSVSSEWGAAIDNGGTLEMSGGSVSGYSCAIDNSRTVAMSGGSVFSNSGTAITNTDTVEITGGSVSGYFCAIDNSAGGTVTIGEESDKVPTIITLTAEAGQKEEPIPSIVNGSFTWQGGVLWAKDSSYFPHDKALPTLKPYGGYLSASYGDTVRVIGDGAFSETALNQLMTDSDVNEVRLELTGDKAYRLPELSIPKGKTVTLVSGSLTVDSLTADGAFINDSIMTGRALYINEGGQVKNSETGEMTVLTLVVNGSFINKNDLTISNGTNNENEIVKGALYINYGAESRESSGGPNYTFHNMAGAAVTNYGEVINNGKFFNTAAQENKTAATFCNYGSFTNNGSGTLSNGGSFVNEGSFTNNGAVTGDGSFRQGKTDGTSDPKTTIFTNQGNASFVCGTFDVWVAATNNAEFTVSKSLNINAAFTNGSGGTMDILMDAVVYNRASFVNQGTMVHNAGEFYNEAGSSFVNESGTFLNEGNFEIRAKTESDMADGAMAENKAIFNNGSSGKLCIDTSFRNSGTFVNNGTGEYGVGGFGSFYNGNAENTNALFTNRGSFRLSGDITNYGTLENSKALENVNNTLADGDAAETGTILSAASLNNYGTVKNNSGTSMNLTGSLSNYKTFENAGSVSCSSFVSESSFTNRGAITCNNWVSSVSFENAGEKSSVTVTGGNLEVPEGTTLTVSGGKVDVKDGITNCGTVILSGGEISSETGTAITNYGTVEITGGTVSGAAYAIENLERSREKLLITQADENVPTLVRATSEEENTLVIMGEFTWSGGTLMARNKDYIPYYPSGLPEITGPENGYYSASFSSEVRNLKSTDIGNLQTALNLTGVTTVNLCQDPETTACPEIIAPTSPEPTESPAPESSAEPQPPAAPTVEVPEKKTLNIKDNVYLSISKGASLSVEGTMNVTEWAYISNSGSVSVGTKGGICISGESSTFINDGSVSSNGGFRVEDSASFTNCNYFDNAGEFSDKPTTADGNTGRCVNDGDFYNSGKLNISGVFTNSNSFTNGVITDTGISGSVIGSGTFTNESRGTVTNNSSLSCGTFSNFGRLNSGGENSKASISCDAFNNHGILENSGTLTCKGTLGNHVPQAGTTALADGETYSLTNTATLTCGSLNSHAPVRNSGSFTAGAINNHDAIVNEANNGKGVLECTTFNNHGTVNSSGTLTCTGTFGNHVPKDDGSVVEFDGNAVVNSGSFTCGELKNHASVLNTETGTFTWNTFTNAGKGSFTNKGTVLVSAEIASLYALVQNSDGLVIHWGPWQEYKEGTAAAAIKFFYKAGTADSTYSADISAISPVTGTLDLDLNGVWLSLTNGGVISFLEVSGGGKLTILDSSEGEGGKITSGASKTVYVTGEGSTLTLRSGTIENTYPGGKAVLCENSDMFVQSGGKISERTSEPSASPTPEVTETPNPEITGTSYSAGRPVSDDLEGESEPPASPSAQPPAENKGETGESAASGTEVADGIRGETDGDSLLKQEIPVQPPKESGDSVEEDPADQTGGEGSDV